MVWAELACGGVKGVQGGFGTAGGWGGSVVDSAAKRRVALREGAMGRLLAFVFGALALALFAVPFALALGWPEQATNYRLWWEEHIDGPLGVELYATLRSDGAGIFAGLALLLFAVRGKD